MPPYSKTIINDLKINVPILARVEGEGSLDLQISDQKIQSLQLRIYEPPRLFEKFLEGRDFNEVLDIVARICGICPVAYQMSATQAIEHCFDIKPTGWIREMRRLFYCGEWIESHSLHVHLLAIPDFFGYASAIEMAKDFPEEIRRGLRLQSIGNSLIKLLGGRSVHPVGACVGGFFHAPSETEASKLLNALKERLHDAEALLRWVAALPLPDNSHEFVCVSLRHPSEYPMNEGDIISTAGLNININEFDDYFKEQQVPYSNALHCHLQDHSYLVGPLARMNLNVDRLPSHITNLLAQLNIHFPSYNMCYSIIARIVEIYYAIYEAIRILENYQFSETSHVEVAPRSGVGFGCTEAPRGLLWQTYKIDSKGMIEKANIIPPTSQNQARIEEDLRISLTQFGLNKSVDELRAYSEMIIRNYDPCISCSTHFLDLRLHR